MQSKNDFSAEQLSAMLAVVAQKMGKTPEQLEAELKKGRISDDRAQKVLENRQELEALLESPKVAELLRDLQQK